MPIDINKFSNRLRTLNETKRAIEETYKNQILAIDKEIEEEKKALEIIRKALEPYICPDCKGSGEKSFLDAAGSKDYKTCPTCKGSGLVG